MEKGELFVQGLFFVVGGNASVQFSTRVVQFGLDHEILEMIQAILECSEMFWNVIE